MKTKVVALMALAFLSVNAPACKPRLEGSQVASDQSFSVLGKLRTFPDDVKAEGTMWVDCAALLIQKILAKTDYRGLNVWNGESIGWQYYFSGTWYSFTVTDPTTKERYSGGLYMTWDAPTCTLQSPSDHARGEFAELFSLSNAQGQKVLRVDGRQWEGNYEFKFNQVTTGEDDEATDRTAYSQIRTGEFEIAYSRNPYESPADAVRFTATTWQECTVGLVGKVSRALGLKDPKPSLHEPKASSSPGPWTTFAVQAGGKTYQGRATFLWSAPECVINPHEGINEFKTALSLSTSDQTSKVLISSRHYGYTFQYHFEVSPDLVAAATEAGRDALEKERARKRDSRRRFDWGDQSELMERLVFFSVALGELRVNGERVLAAEKVVYDQGMRRVHRIEYVEAPKLFEKWRIKAWYNIQSGDGKCWYFEFSGTDGGNRYTIDDVSTPEARTCT